MTYIYIKKYEEKIIIKAEILILIYNIKQLYTK